MTRQLHSAFLEQNSSSFFLKRFSRILFRRKSIPITLLLHKVKLFCLTYVLKSFLTPLFQPQFDTAQFRLCSCFNFGLCLLVCYSRIQTLFLFHPYCNWLCRFVTAEFRHCSCFNLTVIGCAGLLQQNSDFVLVSSLL